MNVKGTKYVWAVRTRNRFGTDYVEVFLAKPTRRRSTWDRSLYWDYGENYGDGRLWVFCGKDFSRIARLPFNRPVKLTIKVTLK